MLAEYDQIMIRIQFKDETEKRKAFAYLMGRYSFRSFATGEMILPEYALPDLAREGVSFVVEGPATYEQITAAFRNPPAQAVNDRQAVPDCSLKRHLN